MMDLEGSPKKIRKLGSTGEDEQIYSQGSQQKTKMMDSECSPRKIRKVESTGEDKQIFSQGSQETWATSTPTKRREDPNISITTSLSSIPSASEVDTKRSTTRTDDDIISIILSNMERFSISETSVGTSVNLLLNSRPQIFKGKLWQYFKPKNEESLYGKVISDFDGISDCAVDLVNDLQANPKNTTIILIKFLVDLCGYQSAEIEQYLNFEQDFKLSSEKLIRMMETILMTDEIAEINTSIYREAEKTNNKLGPTLAAAVTKFLQSFYSISYEEGILYSDTFSKYIFNVIFFMCLSHVKSIKHTGLVLVRITLTSLNYFYLQVLRNLEEPETGDRRLAIEKEKSYLEKYLKYFFPVFASQKLAMYPDLYVCTVGNIEKLSSWMIELPDIYFERGLEFLLKFMVHQSSVLRMGAIQVSKKLVQHKSTYGRKHIKTMLSVVSERTADINDNVAVKAIELLTFSLGLYHTRISDKILEGAINLLYGKTYNYGKAAGGFVYKYLQLTLNDDKLILNNLIKTSTIPKFQNMEPLLIESLSEYDTVLQDYEFLFQKFIESAQKQRIDYAHNLVKLIYFSIHQKLKGESTIKRPNYPPTTASPSCHQRISTIIFSKINDLFKLYQIDPVLFDYIPKILCLINYESLVSSNRVHYTFVLKKFRHIYLNEMDHERLRNIRNFFNYFCTQNTPIKEEAELFVQRFIEQNCNLLEDYLKPDKPEVDFGLHYLKIGIFYEQFNLCQYLDWRKIFTNWENIVMCEGQMIACNQFLFWSIKELVDVSDNQSKRVKLQYLKLHFTEYVEALVQIITDGQHNDKMLKYKAFEYICTLHISCDKIIYDKPEIDEFRSFLLENFRRFFPNPLLAFVENNIITDNSLPIEIRKNLLWKWLDIVLNSIVDVINTVTIMKYYYSHPEYDFLVESTCQEYYKDKPEVVFNLILATLRTVGVNIFKVEESIPLSSPQVIDLMKLAAKLATMEVCANSGQISRMLSLGFNGAFRSDGFLEFLHLLQYFIQHLTRDDARECLDIFIDGTPVKYEKHDYVKSFRAKLKMHTMNRGRKVNVSDITSLVSKSSENPSAENIPITRKTPKRNEQKGRATSNTKKKTTKKPNKENEKNSDEENCHETKRTKKSTNQ